MKKSVDDLEQNINEIISKFEQSKREIEPNELLIITKLTENDVLRIFRNLRFTMNKNKDSSVYKLFPYEIRRMFESRYTQEGDYSFASKFQIVNEIETHIDFLIKENRLKIPNNLYENLIFVENMYDESYELNEDVFYNFKEDKKIFIHYKNWLIFLLKHVYLEEENEKEIYTSILHIVNHKNNAYKRLYELLEEKYISNFIINQNVIKKTLDHLYKIYQENDYFAFSTIIPYQSCEMGDRRRFKYEAVNQYFYLLNGEQLEILKNERFNNIQKCLEFECKLEKTDVRLRNIKKLKNEYLYVSSWQK